MICRACLKARGRATPARRRACAPHPRLAAGALVAPLSPSWSGRPAEAREVLVRFQGVGRWRADRSLVPRRSATQVAVDRNRPLPPSRRVEVTGPCATRASAGSTPVACSARSIWSARMRAGRTSFAHASPDANTASSQLAWMRPHHRGLPVATVARVTRCERERDARRRQGVHRATRTPSPIAAALPGPSCPRAIGAFFLRAG